MRKLNGLPVHFCVDNRKNTSFGYIVSEGIQTAQIKPADDEPIIKNHSRDKEHLYNVQYDIVGRIRFNEHARFPVMKLDVIWPFNKPSDFYIAGHGRLITLLMHCDYFQYIFTVPELGVEAERTVRVVGLSSMLSVCIADFITIEIHLCRAAEALEFDIVIAFSVIECRSVFQASSVIQLIC